VNSSTLLIDPPNKPRHKSHISCSGLPITGLLYLLSFLRGLVRVDDSLDGRLRFRSGFGVPFPNSSLTQEKILWSTLKKVGGMQPAVVRWFFPAKSMLSDRASFDGDPAGGPWRDAARWQIRHRRAEDRAAELTSAPRPSAHAPAMARESRTRCTGRPKRTGRPMLISSPLRECLFNCECG